MNFYAYIPREDGSEPVGSDNRLIIRDLKTIRGVKKQCSKIFKNKKYRLFTFSNFYDESTFREIK